MRFALLAVLLLAVPAARAQTAAPLPETNIYEISTSKGRIVLRLFDDTPLHRDNFKRRVAEAVYDSTTFFRVIEGFMAQGGDPNTRDDDPSNDGLDSPGPTIPAEIHRPHLRGALAAARQGDHINPERASSPMQFYLVQGRPVSLREMDQITAYVRAGTGDPTYTFDSTLVQQYVAQGGAPYLDGQYTVYGEILQGLDVLDAIAAVDTPRKHGDASPFADRPTERVWMTVRPLDDYTPPAPAPVPTTAP